ncbi:EamA family transporter [Nocardioides jensenii]|uniref:EamA family transporter n=1 Tax=Nocardioides jensenii TaxID=1843 RepID=UPI000830FFF7|nr:EamA family transporter [Nocardioides jensenii]
MPTNHRLLAVCVAVMWGLNFIAIHASLEHFPPLFLVALRFALIAAPTLLLVPRPDVELRWLLGYGVGFGTLQFLFLYWGMAAGMPAGLASLVLQASAPFTVLIGVTIGCDRLGARRSVGILVAVAGLALVGWQRAESAALLPFLLVLAGAFGWAIGNVCNARAKAPNPLHLTLWMSVVPVLPMLVLALVLEGPQRIADSLTGLDDPTAGPAWLGLVYTVLIGTVAGSGVWSWLMTRHPAGVVAPFSMLVPVVGMSAAWIMLGETVSTGELAGATLVVAGVLLGSRQAAALPAPDRGLDARKSTTQRAKINKSWV